VKSGDAFQRAHDALVIECAQHLKEGYRPEFFGKVVLIPNLYSTFFLKGRMDRETRVTIPNLYSIFFPNYCMDCESCTMMTHACPMIPNLYSISFLRCCMDFES
jgi:hypothetical protein